LTDDEKLKVIEIVAQEVNGRVQVIPDVGTECYSRTLKLAKECEKMGVDAIILFTPYLDIPTVPGLYKYYNDIADSLNKPILLHNVPGRTNVDMSPELISKLADHPNIIGIKDGNTSLEHVSETIMLTKEKDFSVLTGKDTLGYPLLRLGGHGHISVAANLIPDKIVKIIEYSSKGNFEEAQKIYDKYYSIFKLLYVETNPIPVKYAMNKILFEVGIPRIPLTPLSENNALRFEEQLKKVGLM
jgi:4-hydroxy-tetrahydrodipicolinate synthase